MEKRGKKERVRKQGLKQASWEKARLGVMRRRVSRT